MEQRQKSFKELLSFGEEGEHEVARVLIDKGIKVMPLYQFNAQEAPYFIDNNNKIVSPDLICFSKDCFFVEVKTKNQWVTFQGVETGINKRHFDEYKQIQDITNKKFYLFFNHKVKEPIGLYFCELDSYTRIWDGRSSKGIQVQPEMVFYSKDVLSKHVDFGLPKPIFYVQTALF